MRVSHSKYKENRPKRRVQKRHRKFILGRDSYIGNQRGYDKLSVVVLFPENLTYDTWGLFHSKCMGDGAAVMGIQVGNSTSVSKRVTDSLDTDLNYHECWYKVYLSSTSVDLQT